MFGCVHMRKHIPNHGQFEHVIIYTTKKHIPNHGQFNPTVERVSVLCMN